MKDRASLERLVLLKVGDSKWMDHIDAMDNFARGIYLSLVRLAQPCSRIPR